MNAYVYILKCNDSSYYVASTRDTLERRVAEHNDGTFGGYTNWRRPVELMFSEAFENITDAIAAERKIKGWTHTKNEALIAGDMAALSVLSRRGKRETTK